MLCLLMKTPQRKKLSLIPYAPHFTGHWLLSQNAQTDIMNAANSLSCVAFDSTNNVFAGQG